MAFGTIKNKMTIYFRTSTRRSGRTFYLLTMSYTCLAHRFGKIANGKNKKFSIIIKKQEYMLYINLLIHFHSSKSGTLWSNLCHVFAEKHIRPRYYLARRGLS